MESCYFVGARCTLIIVYYAAHITMSTRYPFNWII